MLLYKITHDLLFLVVGVCLMCVTLHLLMIAVEVTFGWIRTKVNNEYKTKKDTDLENPAAAVGSFRRYKN